MKVKLHRFTEPRAFRSCEHFIGFVDAQIEKLEALRTDPSSEFQRWGPPIVQNWHRARNAAQSVNATGDSISAQILETPCIEPDSDLGRLLVKFGSQNLSYSIDGIMRILRPSMDSHGVGNVTWGTVLGAVEALSAIMVAKKISRPSAAQMLEQLIRDHESRMDDILQGDQVKLNEKSEQFEAFYLDWQERKKTIERAATESLNKGQSQWLEAYDSYVEQLKTQTAVELWEKRSEKHDGAYRSFRNWSVGFGVVGGAVGLCWIFLGFKVAKLVFPSDPTAQLASYSAGSIVLFTLFIWTLRVLVRSMISENHLQTDASARAAMAHTYLALTKAEPATQDDRAIILASLFAPVSDGLVKDDGMPLLSPASVAAAAISNPKVG